jgi:hypothetical protein
MLMDVELQICLIRIILAMAMRANKAKHPSP